MSGKQLLLNWLFFEISLTEKNTFTLNCIMKRTETVFSSHIERIAQNYVLLFCRKVHIIVVKEVQFAVMFIKLFFWTLRHVSLCTLGQEHRCSIEWPVALADLRITAGCNSAQTCIIKPFRESLEWDLFKCSHVITSASLTFFYIYIKRSGALRVAEWVRNMAYTLKVICYTEVGKHFLIKKSPLRIIYYDHRL